MSRQNLAETLKGGILLMGILLVLLALFGGLVRLGLGDAKRGPAYKVAVNIEPRAANTGDHAPRPAQTLFDIPADAVDVSPPERIGPDGLQIKMGADSVMYLEAGFRMLECRRFAPVSSPGDVVTA